MPIDEFWYLPADEKIEIVRKDIPPDFLVNPTTFKGMYMIGVYTVINTDITVLVKKGYSSFASDLGRRPGEV